MPKLKRTKPKPPDRTHYGPDRHELVVELGQMLKTIRTEQKITTRGLAALAGVPQCTILRYEGGQREPRIFNLVRIAAALGVVDQMGEFLKKSAEVLDRN